MSWDTNGAHLRRRRPALVQLEVDAVDHCIDGDDAQRPRAHDSRVVADATQDPRGARRLRPRRAACGVRARAVRPPQLGGDGVDE